MGRHDDGGRFTKSISMPLEWKIPKEGEVDSFIKKLEKLAITEGSNISIIVCELLAKWYKEHGEGNPFYKLEKFFGNEKMLAVPAFMENIQKTWIPYLQITNDPIMDEMLDQARKLHIIISAFKETPQDERSITYFKDLRIATHVGRYSY